MFLNVPWDPEDWLEEDRAADVLREMLAPFGGMPAEVRDHHIDDQSEIVFKLVEWLVAPAPWHRGRVVLIGDAAHAVPPHLGQGAAQAIEDGIVLSQALENAASVEGALLEYEARRYERCKFIVEACVQIGEWETHRSPDEDHVGLTQRAIEKMLAPV
jgi:2-polyprenyl-6-methoxyphenol hydroxylase-like FAD-dependent oxidoreductase